MLGGATAGRALTGSRAVAIHAWSALATRVATRDQLQLATWVLFPAAAISAAWLTLHSTTIAMATVEIRRPHLPR